MSYALNNIDQFVPPDCPRCGKPAQVDWCDNTGLGDPEPSCLPGRIWCATQGCVDETGSNTVNPPPPPPTVEELQRRADQAWIDRHLALTREQS